MALLLHLSDPHFGTERPDVVAALLALAERERPDVLVWSGDITQRARQAQFQAARQLSDRLCVPHMLCIPGNHDIPLFNLPVRLLDPYRGLRRAFGSQACADPVLSLPGLLLVGVNTTRRWRHKNGEVSRAQIARTSERLRGAQPDQLRVVVVHQPLWVAGAQDRHNLLRGHEAALSGWAEAGADILLSGHIHLPSVHALTVNTPAGPREVWNIQAGTSLSRRVRGGTPNSINLIRYQSGRADGRVIERWDFDAEKAAFANVGRFAL